MHPFGFITRIYHDARSSERQSNKPFEAWWLLYEPSGLILTILHFACTVPLCVQCDFHKMQLSFLYITFAEYFLFPERKNAVSSVTVELNL